MSYLGNQTLEESGGTLILHHVGNDSETTLGVLKVAVLDTGLDDVEGSGDEEGGGGTGDGGDEVLEPRGLVVVLELEKVLLCEGGTTEELLIGKKHRLVTAIDMKMTWECAYSEGTRSVTGGGPAPTSVQAEALVGDDSEDTTAAEGLGVCLSLDLEDVEGKEDDLSDTDQTVIKSRRQNAILVPTDFFGLRALRLEGKTSLTCRRWSA